VKPGTKPHVYAIHSRGAAAPQLASSRIREELRVARAYSGYFNLPESAWFEEFLLDPGWRTRHEAVPRHVPDRRASRRVARRSRNRHLHRAVGANLVLPGARLLPGALRAPRHLEGQPWLTAARQAPRLGNQSERCDTAPALQVTR